MRRIVIVSLGLVAAATFSGCSKKPGVPDKPNSPKPVVEGSAPAKALGPAALPHRKPGLWSQTMATRGMTQQTKICIGPDTEAKVTPWGQAMGKNLCSKNAVSRTPTGWAFESECDMGEGGHIASHGEASGDFDGGYTMKITSVTTGSSMAQANGTHEMTLQAKYEGACPADMKSGDMTMSMPGMRQGMKINVEQMAAMRK
ncbi:MAG: DUF3617 family protein [Caulobacterales bacterium]|nr:DUF3617 family protein [Caulobacterales bacterium]